MYIDDCVYGTQALMASDVRRTDQYRQRRAGHHQPTGRHRRRDCRIKLKRRFNLDAPKGVRGRNSDNTLIKQKLGWAPSTPLLKGCEKTYRWIHEEMHKHSDERRRAYR